MNEPEARKAVVTDAPGAGSAYNGRTGVVSLDKTGRYYEFRLDHMPGWAIPLEWDEFEYLGR